MSIICEKCSVPFEFIGDVILACHRIENSENTFELCDGGRHQCPVCKAVLNVDYKDPMKLMNRQDTAALIVQLLAHGKRVELVWWTPEAAKAWKEKYANRLLGEIMADIARGAG